MSINQKPGLLLSPLLNNSKRSMFAPNEPNLPDLDGQKEIVTFEDRGEYKGPVDKKNLPHGIGKFTFKDGSIFIGQFNKGILEGLGRLENFEKKISYQGEWKNWKRDGKGKEEMWQTGEIYDGAWVKGERTGYGKQI